MYVVVFLLFVLVIAVAILLAREPRLMVGAADFVKDLKKSPRSKSEAFVVKYFEDITGREFPTVLPKWLSWRGRSLELDGYCEELGIAVEFSGPLHTKWSPSVEPYKKYFARVVRDVVKRRVCERRGVKLVVVDMSLPPHHWRGYVASRLFDVGFLKEKPSGYIEEQTAIPYRNEHLEAELGLGAEWAEVEAV